MGTWHQVQRRSGSSVRGASAVAMAGIVSEGRESCQPSGEAATKPRLKNFLADRRAFQKNRGIVHPQIVHVLNPLTER